MTELEELDRRYASGQFDAIRGDLERFLAAHREEIVRCIAELAGVSPADAVKRYIIGHRTINAERDISEQLEEIRKEKWIRGVQDGCAPDPQKVAADWSRQYSAAWRAHRITAIVYVFEREKERFLKLLA